MALINDNGIPAIFTEEYSADSTAKAIARKSGVAIFSLSMMMSGPVEGAGLETYVSLLEQNVNTILEALA